MHKTSEKTIYKQFKIYITSVWLSKQFHYTYQTTKSISFQCNIWKKNLLFSNIIARESTVVFVSLKQKIIYSENWRPLLTWIKIHYLCNRCLSPLTLWVRIPLMRFVLDTTLCDQVCQWLAADRWFPPGTHVSSTNKTDRQDITEILLKVVLNTITLTPNPIHSIYQ